MIRPQCRPTDDALERVCSEYDSAPYGFHSYPQSAPGHLAVTGYLLGLDGVPDVATARVLEIGCATGSNLVPFAAFHPDARVVGIDLSPVQIEIGRQCVRDLGLTNLDLRVGDVTQIDTAEFGEFDYIICHGVYSWVPTTVADAILAIIRQLLAPNGIAYLSYNVYPGWKNKEIVRDAMTLFGVGGADVDQDVRDARGLIDLLGDVAPADGVLAKVLADYETTVGAARDYYMLHDELSTFNEPCYFLQMVERANDHGLIYLAEARLQVMFAGNYGTEVAQRLLDACGDSQLALEQCLDFVSNRTFRQSLLINAECAPQIRYHLDRQRYPRLHIAARMPSVDGTIALDTSRQTFGAPGEPMVFTSDPALKVALDVLNSRWPGTLSWAELQQETATRLDDAGYPAGDDLAARIDDLLTVLILNGSARYRLDPVSIGSTSTARIDKPSRLMAELGRGEAEAVTFNRWHEMFSLSAVDRHLLPLLGGEFERDKLLDALRAAVRRGQIEIDDEELRAQVDTLPERLATMRLCGG
ncbi:methyltransferase regulatory domain-containing protein [Mycolicibacterium sphagni]|uniref:methyltransferase regulatory domain-containing protein n=1 Tax=Mycolicibacterium sphagni TaxID=1786 RepID=UPI0021F36B7A|nr:class I SAM-dependent methyltransferase [Mycolicibacterium sphagni]MCV7175320.1 methyltransferase regulatory domain-containing protein [Mycolicibacterium sphagni]